MPIPTKSFAGQTIIVTGSNTGMGLEAARYFVQLSAAKVIIAVRSLSKGEAAKVSIETSEKRLNIVEVWELDLSSYASVKAFVVKGNDLERLDVVVANAGMYSFDFAMAEENERTITCQCCGYYVTGIDVVAEIEGDECEVEERGGVDVHWIFRSLYDQISREEGGAHL